MPEIEMMLINNRYAITFKSQDYFVYPNVLYGTSQDLSYLGISNFDTYKSLDKNRIILGQLLVQKYSININFRPKTE